MSADPDGLVRFLRHVLPSEGVYVYCWKDTEWRQRSAGTIADVADAVRALSAQGRDTYFACGSFIARGARTALNSAGARCLWFDVDVDAQKAAKKLGYLTVGDAAKAVRRFCDETGLPLPTVVSSGHGIHGYWTLDRTLEPAAWKRAAERLYQLCLAYEFYVDPMRARDIASVLRPPTTYNYKNGAPAHVVAGELRSALSVDYFLGLLPAAPAASAAPQRRALSNDDAALFAYADDPSFAATVAEKCGWIRRVGREQRGNVPEPMWYAMLGLLAFAADGDTLAHEWSDGHPTYAYEATEAKLNQAREKQSGPTTCAQFQRVWAEGCKGCPYQGTITSPLALGRDRPHPSESQKLRDPTNIKAVGLSAGSRGDTDRIPVIPYPYSWSPIGALLVKAKNPQGEDEVHTLYPYPIFVTALRSGEVTAGSFTTLKHWAPHDGWREVTLPSGDLTAEGFNRVLGNNHIEIPNERAKAFASYLSKAKSAYRDAHPADLQHETFGWKEESFLIGEALYTPQGMQDAGLSDEIKKYSSKFTKSGSLTEWTKAAQQLFLPGYEHQALGVLASFGAVLMRWADYPGLIYSIVHPLSGQGKTLTVEAANSVWAGDQALFMSHRDEKVTTGDTLNSQFRQMALFKNLPIVVDEMRDQDPEKLRGFVLTFTGGNPKKGLTKEGKLRDQLGLWQTLMLTTSNKSLIDIVTVNNDAAAATRIFEVSAVLPPDADAARGNAIRDALRRNHGTAGPAFIMALLKPGMFAWVERTVKQLVVSFTVEMGSRGGTDRYAASFMACVFVAAMICAKEGIVQTDMQSLKGWMLERWRRQRDQVEGSQRTAAEALSAFIRDKWSQALIVADEVRPPNEAMVTRHPLKDPLVMRYDQAPGRILVDRTALQRWCLSENIHFGALGDELQKLGVLLSRDNYKNLGAATMHKGSGQVRVWSVDALHPALSGQIREIVDPARADRFGQCRGS